jgi:hypothetical protein
MTQRAASGRAQSGGVASREQLVVVVAAAVVVVAVLIVVVGVFVTRYRPPRAHVLSVGEEQFNAADVERRLRYLLIYNAAQVGTDVDAIVDSALTTLEREQIVRQRAPALVGDVSPEDVEQELRTQLVPSAPPVTQPDGSTSTPVPVSDEAYANALQQRLQESGLSKEQLETLARAELLEKKLAEHFKASLPAQAPQVRLSSARLSEQAKADEVRSIVLRPGVDFVQVAAGNSVNTGGPVGDLDWVLLEELDAAVRDAVQALEAGAVTPVIKNDEYYELYKVTEARTERDLTDEQRDTLAAKRVDEWVDAERKSFQVERDLSESEEAWIRSHALDAYGRAVGQVR